MKYTKKLELQLAWLIANVNLIILTLLFIYKLYFTNKLIKIKRLYI